MKNFLFAIFLLAFASCNLDLGKPSWDTGVKAPILSSTLSLDQLVKDSLFIRGANAGDISYIQYRQNLIKLKVDSLFKLPDTTNTEVFQLPFGPIAFAPGQVLTQDTTTTRYRLNGIQLHEATFREGKLALEVFSNIQEEIQIQYLIPNSSKPGGFPFSFSIFVPAGSISNPTTYRDTFDLTNYIVDLRGKNQDHSNTITALFSASISPNAAANISLNTSDYITINTTLVNTIPEYVRGFFSNQIFEVEKQFAEADVFNIFKDGKVVFGDPNVSLFIENQLGVDFAGVGFKISGKNTNTGNEVELQSPLLNNIKVSRAYNEPDNNPQYRANKITATFRKENSNLQDVLAINPNEIWYEANMEVNPLGNISGYNDFVYYNTGIQLGIEVLLPMFFDELSNLEIVDTAAYIFEKDPAYDNIQDGFMQLMVKNNFEFQISPSLIIFSEDGEVLDTLLDYSTPIPGETTRMIPIPVNQEKLGALYDGKKMLVRMKIDHFSSTAIRAYTSDNAEITLISDFNYRLNIK